MSVLTPGPSSRCQTAFVPFAHIDQSNVIQKFRLAFNKKTFAVNLRHCALGRVGHTPGEVQKTPSTMPCAAPLSDSLPMPHGASSAWSIYVHMTLPTTVRHMSGR